MNATDRENAIERRALEIHRYTGLPVTLSKKDYDWLESRKHIEDSIFGKSFRQIPIKRY